MLRRLLSRMRGTPEEREPAPQRAPLPPARTLSVITPSFNQGRFLPRCLASVAAQTHAPVEHLVYDPGSTDDSREVVARFAHATLIAEPDEGQADAVGKGMRAAKGDVIAWLNADDEFADAGVFAAVMERFNASDGPDVVYGLGEYVDTDGRVLKPAYVNRKPKTLPVRLQSELGILQPALFLRREVVERIGVPDATLTFALDYEFWTRGVKAGLRFAFLDRKLALARYYPDNKTMGRRGESYVEALKVGQRHFGYVHERWARRYSEFRVGGLDGVLQHSGNAAIDRVAVDAETARVLGAWNASYAALTHLREHATEEPVAQTVSAMRSAGLPLEPHCKPVDEGVKSNKEWTCYTVEKQRWAFDAGWVREQTERTRAAFERFAAERANDTCVIVGNGPSLNQTDLSLLEGRDVFCSNYAYLKPELWRHAKYLAVVNNLVAEQGAGEINLLGGVRKLFPYWLSYCIRPDEETYFFHSVGVPEFSLDIHRNVSWRHTVTFFHLQIAYGLGYRRAVMVGFDHNYAQQPGVVEGAVIDQQSSDQNHFDPSYFKGKKWHAADVDNMEAMYRLAKSAYEADGREIVNATVGGRLELFPRMDLAEAVAGGARSADRAGHH